MPTFFLSGAIYPLSNLPKAMSLITHADPLTYGIDALRGSLLRGLENANHFSLLFDVTILAASCLIAILAGSYLFSKIEI